MAREGLGDAPASDRPHALNTGQHVALVTTAFLTLNILALYANRYGHQLRTLAAHLQEKVGERTAELTSANAELAHAYEDLRAAEAQLLETEKRASLGLLVSGVAHEINNPVSFIVGNVDQLRSSLATLQDLAQRHRDGELGVGRGEDRQDSGHHGERCRAHRGHRARFADVLTDRGAAVPGAAQRPRGSRNQPASAATALGGPGNDFATRLRRHSGHRGGAGTDQSGAHERPRERL